MSAAPSCVSVTLTKTVLMMRVARKDYTFADGSRIPQGTTVPVNPTQAHHGPATYEDPERFDGFRFAKMRLQQDSKTYDVVATSPKFLPFGHGRHACPGRYSAGFKLKIMLAHTVLNYDVKMENGACGPLMSGWHRRVYPIRRVKLCSASVQCRDVPN